MKKALLSIAIFSLTGVSKNNSRYNLMYESDNDIEHVHLTFR